MKKKKLHLQKVTLRSLNEQALPVAGATGFSCDYTCFTDISCNTCSPCSDYTCDNTWGCNSTNTCDYTCPATCQVSCYAGGGCEQGTVYSC
ncbi:MAG: hypothetical protein JWN34_798 [Bryobacterales bacterium]|nr:hypothetical protein [Bryobacterales bacterium]